MHKQIIIFLLFITLGILAWVGYTHLQGHPIRPQPASAQGDAPKVDFEKLLREEVGGYRKVHVFVALCDNKNQGIVPVPASIGNGQDPKSNLYWGARYGVKTFFKRSRDWQLVAEVDNPKDHVLQRLVFCNAKAKVYLVADAYDGAFMKETITAMLSAAAGAQYEVVAIAGNKYVFSGGAQLIAFIGHNGLMDFTLDAEISHRDKRRREVILLCCASQSYFPPLLKTAGASPLLGTTGLMCPEAYTLDAALAGWVKEETPQQIHERAAQAYHKYQRCGIKAARKLFKMGF